MTPGRLLAICGVILAGAVHAGEPSVEVYIGQVTGALSYGDRMEIQQALQQRRTDRESAAFLKDLWSGEREKHPRLPWARIEEPSYRLEIGLALLRAGEAGRVEAPISEIRGYAREHALSDNAWAATRAVTVFGLIPDADDVPLLARVVAREIPASFELAVAALVSGTAPESKAALQALRPGIRRPELARRFDEIVEKRLRPDDIHREHQERARNR